MAVAPGDHAPPFVLDDVSTGERVDTPPWADGPVVLAFFKVTCPVCQMAAPKLQALADAGVRVTAIGEDPPAALNAYNQRFGQAVTTLTEPPPYRVSEAYGVTAVPTLFLVDQAGTVQAKVGGWDRQGWNALAAEAGAPAISADGDGLPSYRPG